MCFVWQDSSRTNSAEIVQIFETVLRNDITPSPTSILDASSVQAAGGASTPVRHRSHNLLSKYNSAYAVAAALLFIAQM